MLTTVFGSLRFIYILDSFTVLIESHLWLADKYVAIFANSYNRDEWRAAALSGITEAAHRWRLEKSNGAQFSSYAHYWILAKAREVWLLGKPSRREGSRIILSDYLDLLAYEETHSQGATFGIEVAEIDVSLQLELLLWSLSEQDRFLLSLRFGFPPFMRGHTFNEIADICCMKRVEAAWHNAERALKNLRSLIRRYGLWSILRECL